MQTHPRDIDVLATADATRILCELRLANGAAIPLAAWRMMANAEARLNDQIESYFRGDEPAR